MITSNATAHAASTSGASGGGAAPENPGAVLGQDDFLKLMIAQLQAQDPLNPGNTNEYISELAQFTQVEQTTNLASASELSGAVQLIGHTVSYNNGAGEVIRGKVQSVQSGTTGPTVTIEGVAGIKLSSVMEVD